MSATRNSDIGRDTGVRYRAFVALLALLLLQVIYAGHQFDHSAGDISSACGICLQLDRVDDGVYAASIAVSVVPVIYRERPIVDQPFGLRTDQSVSARGPPIIV